MKKQFALSILALCVLLGATQFTFAQDLNIDDFKAGGYQSPQFYGGDSNHSSQNGPLAHILGGNRYTNLDICPTRTCSNNPFHQPSSYQFRPGTGGGLSAFLMKSGFNVPPRVDMEYGLGSPMHADFSGFKNGWIRLNFKGLTENLNFNILLFTNGVFAESGCNLAAVPGDFSIEAPFSRFTDNGIDYSNISAMDFIFQSGSGAFGSMNLLVTSIEVSNTHKVGAISCPF